jgi:protein tyrosine phosphatase (PTP) superfamily phosphohydrolase (DUF442 family)
MSFASHRLIALLVFGLPVFAGSAPGIKNFDQVDEHVYRGGQPTDTGFQYLANLGVKTIIDLRETGDRSKAEERVVTGARMKYINVPMTGFTAPTEADITKASRKNNMVILLVEEFGNSSRRGTPTFLDSDLLISTSI